MRFRLTSRRLFSIVYSMQKLTSPAAAGRSNLGQGLVSDLRRLIGAGDIPDGSRINEVHLSRELGVSRTPLREALIGLAAEGLVAIKPRRGFFVAPLETKELADLYAMRALLDPAALRVAGIPAEKQIKALETLNKKLERTKSVRQVVDLDNQWHRALLAHCPNEILLQTIEQFIGLTQRYEEAYFRETSHIVTAFGEHEAILAALTAGDLGQACEALHQNMQSAVKPLQDWLKSRCS